MSIIQPIIASWNVENFLYCRALYRVVHYFPRYLDYQVFVACVYSSLAVLSTFRSVGDIDQPGALFKTHTISEPPSMGVIHVSALSFMPRASFCDLNLESSYRCSFSNTLSI